MRQDMPRYQSFTSLFTTCATCPIKGELFGPLPALHPSMASRHAHSKAVVREDCGAIGHIVHPNISLLHSFQLDTPASGARSTAGEAGVDAFGEPKQRLVHQDCLHGPPPL